MSPPARAQDGGWKIGWGITDECNMHCDFCYSRSVRSGGEVLPLEVLKAFVDRNARFIDSINYGTGENVMSESWSELVEYVRGRYGIRQALTTNGTLAPWVARHPQRVTSLECLHEVDVSLDYCDPGRHCLMRKHTMAHQWALDTVRLCRKHSIQTTLVVLAIDETMAIDNLRGVFDLAAQHGAFVRLNICRPTYVRGPGGLSYRSLQRALHFILEHYAVVALSDQLLSAVIAGVERRDATGRTSLRILPNGAITPSTYLVGPEWWAGNIREADLGDESLAERLLSGVRCDGGHAEACAPCEAREICGGGVLDRRILWYGSLRERDPYCPARHNDSIVAWRPEGRIAYARGPTIHDGYLPTLIFSPQRTGV
jgi:radical SAM protein with 4Fe4S-binding SPASM domain